MDSIINDGLLQWDANTSAAFDPVKVRSVMPQAPEAVPPGSSAKSSKVRTLLSKFGCHFETRMEVLPSQGSRMVHEKQTNKPIQGILNIRAWVQL